MPTDHILALLIAECDKLNPAIKALRGPSMRQGRLAKDPAAVTPQAKMAADLNSYAPESGGCCSGMRCLQALIWPGSLRGFSEVAKMTRRPQNLTHQVLTRYNLKRCGHFIR
jgi:hypothetical protein